MPKATSTLTTGLSELLVLQLLAHREMYGYELAKTARVATREAFRLGEGALYPLLHSLEVRQLVRSRRQLVNGRARVYYALTSRGRKRLHELSEHWEKLSAGVDAARGGLVYV
jgi:DNA-binding PadR family transcriptional regulator